MSRCGRAIAQHCLGHSVLTWVAERLTLTRGLFGVLLLVLVLVAALALWLQTGAQRSHASACWSEDNNTNASLFVRMSTGIFWFVCLFVCFGVHVPGPHMLQHSPSFSYWVTGSHWGWAAITVCRVNTVARHFIQPGCVVAEPRVQFLYSVTCNKQQGA